MFPKLLAQRGSALVIAVFIIVVMLMLALSLLGLLRSSSETVVYEVQGSRTLFAAQSALELALTELFPLNAGTQNCAALTPEHSFTGTTASQCTVSIRCKAYQPAAGEAAALFQLTSTAQCQVGEVQTRRTVLLEVR